MELKDSATFNRSLLIIDDNPSFSRSLIQMLEDEYRIHSVSSSNEAMNLLDKEEIHVILLDIRLGRESGLEILPRIRKKVPEQPVIMLTGFASIESAVECIKQGAYDYLQKPIKYAQLKSTIQNALSKLDLKRENHQLHSQVQEKTSIMHSLDPGIAELLSTAKRLAASKIPFLITGENGSGKEVLADYIHSQSQRRYKPLLKFNCAAFPENLLDNELFGHEKGAFTGASSEYKGVFERAHKGTLFLDEIGDMSLSVQAKVLRVLQNGELYRLGGKDKICVDIHFLSATNKDLKGLIDQGLFRQDLYYRLNAATLRIPPLRERKCDIPDLSNFFLSEFCTENGKNIEGFSESVLSLFHHYDWPGNIRELKNTIAYCAAICQTGVIGEEDLPVEMKCNSGRDRAGKVLDLSEKRLLLQELNRLGNNKKKVAESLNISRSTLYSKLKKHEILR